MTYEEYKSKYDGKGVDFDGYYGFQCMDNYRQYCKEVLEVPQSPSVSGAKDVWTTYLSEHFDKFDNSPTAVPQKGDIVIWGTGVGPYGHIGVFDSGDVNAFKSFDQNWPVNSLCHLQQHNYNGVLGWIRKKAPPQPAVPEITDSTKIPGLDNKEVQQIRSELNAKDSKIAELTLSVDSLKAQRDALQKEIDNIPDGAYSQADIKLEQLRDLRWSSNWWWVKYSKWGQMLPKK